MARLLQWLIGLFSKRQGPVMEVYRIGGGTVMSAYMAYKASQAEQRVAVLEDYLSKLRERTPHPFLKAEIDELIGKSD